MIPLSPDTEALAHRLATAESLSPEDAIRLALEDRAKRLALSPKPRPRKDLSEEAIRARIEQMDRVAAEIKAMPLLDSRSVEEIVDDLNAI